MTPNEFRDFDTCVRLRSYAKSTQRLRKLFKCNLRTDVQRMISQEIFAKSRAITTGNLRLRSKGKITLHLAGCGNSRSAL